MEEGEGRRDAVVDGWQRAQSGVVRRERCLQDRGAHTRARQPLRRPLTAPAAREVRPVLLGEKIINPHTW